MIAASLTNCILHFKAQVQITLVTKKLLVLKKRWIVYTLPFMLDWLPGIYAQTIDCKQSRVEHHFRKIGSQIFGQKTHTFFWKMYFRRLEFSSVNSHNFNKNHEYFFLLQNFAITNICNACKTISFQDFPYEGPFFFTKY